jgi:hypothetical protein
MAKLFDIAVNHLQGLDFSCISLDGVRMKDELSFYERLEFEILNEATISRQEIFKATRYTYGHSEYYVDLVFAAATYHMIFKANNITSYFDVAFEIIESNKDVLQGEFVKHKNTIYPKVMVDAWISYCESKKDIAQFQKNTAFRNDLFYVAYHHYLGEKELAPYSILI